VFVFLSLSPTHKPTHPSTYPPPPPPSLSHAHGERNSFSLFLSLFVSISLCVSSLLFLSLRLSEERVCALLICVLRVRACACSLNPFLSPSLCMTHYKSLYDMCVWIYLSMALSVVHLDSCAQPFGLCLPFSSSLPLLYLSLTHTHQLTLTL